MNYDFSALVNELVTLYRKGITEYPVQISGFKKKSEETIGLDAIRAQELLALLTRDQVRKLDEISEKLCTIYKEVPQSTHYKLSKNDRERARIQKMSAFSEEYIYRQAFEYQIYGTTDPEIKAFLDEIKKVSTKQGKYSQEVCDYHIKCVYHLIRYLTDENRHSDRYDLVRDYLIYHCYHDAIINMRLEEEPNNPESVISETDRLKKFRKYVMDFLKQGLKRIWHDSSGEPYQLEKYFPIANTSIEAVLEDIAAMHLPTIKILDLSHWEGFPSKDFLKQIPPYIHTVNFPLMYLTNGKKEAELLSWLPPHIKTIGFPKEVRVLTRDQKSYYSYEVAPEIVGRFFNNLPFTLDFLTGLYPHYLQLTNKAPDVPASYNTVFEQNPDASAIMKMSFLLLNYLGRNSKSEQDGPIRTWMRTIGREHRNQVDSLLTRITNQEFKKPIELLNALKEIAEGANPHGGLKRRIDYFSQYLATHPEIEAEHQLQTGPLPSCSSK